MSLNVKRSGNYSEKSPESSFYIGVKPNGQNGRLIISTPVIFLSLLPFRGPTANPDTAVGEDGITPLRSLIKTLTLMKTCYSTNEDGNFVA